ncbi:MAG: hypothetical protein RLZZ59_308 [Pseudomonadota bacterium]|jgi:beta-N-acetylhexosaminidase
MLPVIFGISGTELSQGEIDFFAQHRPHGIILFGRNCKEATQIRGLTNSIKNILGTDVKIFIDQEGGRVARIKPPITETIYPNMAYFGEMYKIHGAQDAISAVKNNYFKLMSELKTFGIDVTCAPVCDIYYEGAHKVIGDRSFGSNLEIVVTLCKAALEGIHTAGGEGVIKHIPGHGRADVDSHLDLPVVSDSLKDLEGSDFAVFKSLSDSCPYAMTAHVKYTCLDEELPVTISKKCINYIRSDIGFTSQIMTDDICMKALGGTIQDRVGMSLKAGCDIILHCSGKIQEMVDVVMVL